DELVVADLDEALAGADLQHLPLVLDARLDRLAQGLALDASQKGLDHAELDVGLEQAQAHLAQGGVDVALVELGEPGEAVARLAESLGDGLEHDKKAGSSKASPPTGPAL